MSTWQPINDKVFSTRAQALIRKNNRAHPHHNDKKPGYSHQLYLCLKKL